MGHEREHGNRHRVEQQRTDERGFRAKAVDQLAHRKGETDDAEREPHRQIADLSLVVVTFIEVNRDQGDGDAARHADEQDRGIDQPDVAVLHATENTGESSHEGRPSGRAPYSIHPGHAKPYPGGSGSLA